MTTASKLPSSDLQIFHALGEGVEAAGAAPFDRHGIEIHPDELPFVRAEVAEHLQKTAVPAPHVQDALLAIADRASIHIHLAAFPRAPHPGDQAPRARERVVARGIDHPEVRRARPRMEVHVTARSAPHEPEWVVRSVVFEVVAVRFGRRILCSAERAARVHQLELSRGGAVRVTPGCRKLFSRWGRHYAPGSRVSSRRSGGTGATVPSARGGESRDNCDSGRAA